MTQITPAQLNEAFASIRAAMVTARDSSNVVIDQIDLLLNEQPLPTYLPQIRQSLSRAIVFDPDLPLAKVFQQESHRLEFPFSDYAILLSALEYSSFITRPDVVNFFDPISHNRQVKAGYVGRLNGMPVFTDAFLHVNHRLFNFKAAFLLCPELIATL